MEQGVGPQSRSQHCKKKAKFAKTKDLNTQILLSCFSSSTVKGQLRNFPIGQCYRLPLFCMFSIVHLPLQRLTHAQLVI